MATISQEEMDRRIAAAGGPRMTHALRVGKHKVPNPNYDLYDVASEKEVEVDVQQWTSPEGYTLQAAQLPDGTWEVVKDVPPTPKPTSATAKPPIPPGGSSATEGTPDPSKPGGWDNTRPRQVIRDANGTVVWSEELTGADLNAWRQQQAQTGEKREPVQGRPGWTSVTRTVTHAGNTTTTTVYVGPDGKEVPTLPNDPADRVGKPTGATRTVQNNGVTVKETEYLLPDGTKEWRSQTETTQPDRVGKPTGNTRERTENGQKIKETEYVLPDGKTEWRTQTAQTDGVGNIPGLPTYTPDLTKPGAGLFEYAKQLDEFMKANPSFTWEKRQQVLEAAQKQANTVVQEFNTGAAILREQYQSNVTQRGQDINQANSRAQLANQHHQNAIGLIEKFAPYLGVTPGDAGKLFLGMMASQLATATAYGGMNNYAREEMDPRLLSFADRAVGGAGRPAAAVSPTPPGTPPNALGLGGPGAVFTPQGWTPPPANPDAAMAEAVRQQRAASGQPLPAPVLAPQPQAGSMDATDPAQQGQPAYSPVPVTTVRPVDTTIPQPGYVQPLPPTGTLPMPAAPQPSPIDPIMPNPATQSMAPLESMFANVLPPEPISWHEQAQNRAAYLETPDPSSVARGAALFGGEVPQQPMYGGFSLGGPVGPAPLPLASRIPGLTPEIDAEAKRQLAMGA
jgi:hypothetical protein